MAKEREKDKGWDVEPDVYEAPLPPTPITIEAKTRLRRWGVPNEYVEKLRSMASLFRYDRCPQKVTRIAKNGAYLFRDGGIEKVVLPNYIDGQFRLDGQCGDITAQFIRALNFSGFLAELNAILVGNGRPAILPVYCSGQSRTHFNTEDSIHAWTGLIQEGEFPDSQITADASFQIIDNLGHSGYRLGYPNVAPQILNKGKGAARPIAELVVADDGGHRLINYSSIVLGISFDYKFAYGVGFSRRANDKKVYPFISLTGEEGGGAKATCLISVYGEYRWLGRMDGVEKVHKKEVEQMLFSLKSMAIVADQRTGERHATEKVEINLSRNNSSGVV